MQRSLTDLTKVIAAIAVVGIHATSISEHNFATQQDFFSADFAAVFLNQWARFSVPLFLYLSAFGLSQGTTVGYFAFLKKRLPTILVPYLFFSAIAFALDFKNLNVSHVAERLLKGGADYHLYFLVILAQCYLLFPLLVLMYERSAKIYAVLTALSFLLVILLLYRTTSERILAYLGWPHPGWHASFCIYWLPYFLLGILHGKRPPSPWGKFAAGSAVLISLAMVLADYIIASRQNIPLDYYNHFSRPTVALYALAVVYLLWAVSPHPPAPSPLHGEGGEDLSTQVVSGRFAPLSTWWRGVGGEVAALTFTVYLIHPQILRVLNAYGSSLPTLFIWSATVFISFALVYGLKKILERIESPPVRLLQRGLGLR